MDFVLDLRDEFASAQTIPAVITTIADDDDLLRVGAEFPGHPDLEEDRPLVAGVARPHTQSIVSLSYWEHTPGMYDSLPTAGAILGLFQALTETHRHDLGRPNR